MTKRKHEELSKHEHNENIARTINYTIYHTNTLNSEEMHVYVLQCETPDDAKFVYSIIYSPENNVLVTLHENYVIFSLTFNENTIDEIYKLLNNDKPRHKISNDMVVLIDRHFKSASWRTEAPEIVLPPSINQDEFKKKVTIVIQKKWGEIQSLKAQIQSCSTDYAKQAVFLETIIDTIKLVHGQLDKLLSLFPASMETTLWLTTRKDKTKLEDLSGASLNAKVQHNGIHKIDPSQYRTLGADIAKGISELMLLMNHPNNSNKIQETIIALIEKVYELFFVYQLLRLTNRQKVDAQLNSFFKVNKTKHIKQYNTSNMYNDEIVEKLLDIMTGFPDKTGNTLFVSRVTRPLLEPRTSFITDVANHILRAYEANVTSLIPCRVNLELTSNYMIGLVVKKDNDNVVIKFIDSYGSCFGHQTTVTPNGNFMQFVSKESDFIIEDINNVENIPYLHLPFLLSDTLCHFLDILLLEIRPNIDPHIKVKFIATGIVQQYMSQKDSGPYVVSNLVSESIDKPLEKYAIDSLKKIQQKYLNDDYHKNVPGVS